MKCFMQSEKPEVGEGRWRLPQAQKTEFSSNCRRSSSSSLSLSAFPTYFLVVISSISVEASRQQRVRGRPSVSESGLKTSSAHFPLQMKICYSRICSRWLFSPPGRNRQICLDIQHINLHSKRKIKATIIKFLGSYQPEHYLTWTTKP